ncbi:hypothetical protein [Amycolatopsis samaneae]|uniref:Uncharacterized protein n=1 Tax=Amycolatopsis samaneae TaxID=664691 RepID=A0ABW5GMI2_9PSEU
MGEGVAGLAVLGLSQDRLPASFDVGYPVLAPFPFGLPFLGRSVVDGAEVGEQEVTAVVASSRIRMLLVWPASARLR